MKKIMGFTVCLIVFVLLQAGTFAAPAPEQETKQLMNQFTAARQKLEAGIDYPAFCSLRQELSAAAQKYRDKYPEGDATEDFAYLNRLYADIEETWQLRIEEKVQFFPRTKEQGEARGTSKYFIHIVMLRMQYPEVLNASLESKENGYFVNSVLDNLLEQACRMTKVVSSKVEKAYLK